MKIFVPMALWLCIALFMSSHLSILASVDIRMHLAGDVLNFKNFQIMMLKETLTQMWNAEVYSLFFILFGFSFLWPYIKLIGLLFCWFLPPKSLATAKRGGFISLLDLLGKWSLIDIYVFVLIMSAFLIHIKSPPEIDPLLGENFYKLDLQVTPLFGVLASMIAGVLMPATNEVMIVAHRNAVSDTTERVYKEELQKAALSPSGINGSDNAPPQKDFNSDSGPATSRRRSTWFEAGTNDVKGFRKGLVDHSYALCDHVWENKGGKDRVALKKPGR